MSEEAGSKGPDEIKIQQINYEIASLKKGFVALRDGIKSLNSTVSEINDFSVRRNEEEAKWVKSVTEQIKKHDDSLKSIEDNLRRQKEETKLRNDLFRGASLFFGVIFVLFATNYYMHKSEIIDREELTRALAAIDVKLRLSESGLKNKLNPSITQSAEDIKKQKDEVERLSKELADIKAALQKKTSNSGKIVTPNQVAKEAPKGTGAFETGKVEKTPQ